MTLQSTSFRKIGNTQTSTLKRWASLGLADQLKKALVTYTESGGQGNPTFDTAQAIAVMLEKHGIACDLMHGFNWDKWTTGKPIERLALTRPTWRRRP